MARSVVNLYAEFLLNISQVTIFATLDLTGRDDETAHFASDRQRITITYSGESAAITYPNGISGTAIVHLPIKAAAHVSLRLEITEKGDPYWKNSLETLNDSPWTAHAFSSDTTVACRWCETVFCDPSRIQRWKDLPRSDWAETMDLWHCHKPTESGENHAHAGYNHPDKNGFVQLRQGTAFIDSSDLIVVPADTDRLSKEGFMTSSLMRSLAWNRYKCPRLTPQPCIVSNSLPSYKSLLARRVSWVSLHGYSDTAFRKERYRQAAEEQADRFQLAETQTGESLVECHNCRRPIGRTCDDPAGAYRLHKWNVAVKRETGTSWETNDIQSLLCTQLLELSDSQASKRFLLRGPGIEDQVKPILLWVLNPDLKYCASYVGAGHPRRAMKVLYKDFGDCQAEDSRESDSSLELPSEVVAQIRNTLAESNNMMPPAARSVQGWTAGLLDRFNPGDQAQERSHGNLVEVETPNVSVS